MELEEIREFFGVDVTKIEGMQDYGVNDFYYGKILVVKTNRKPDPDMQEYAAYESCDCNESGTRYFFYMPYEIKKTNKKGEN